MHAEAFVLGGDPPGAEADLEPPSESMSSVASSLASTTGWWRSTLNTRQPTRRSVVTAAAAVIAAIGATSTGRWPDVSAIEPGPK